MFLWYDTETSGLSSECNVLTSYFIITDNDLNVVDEMYIPIKHKKYTVNSYAMEINGIDLELHHKTSHPLKLAQIMFEKFLERNCDGTPYIMAGHNVSFDSRMLRSNKILRDTHEVYIFDESLDTLCILRELKRNGFIEKGQSLSLGNITKHFGIEANGQLHTAEYDIKLTIELYKYIENVFYL